MGQEQGDLQPGDCLDTRSEGDGVMDDGMCAEQVTGEKMSERKQEAEEQVCRG